MAFVTVEVVDKDGNLCPRAENQIFFDVDGPATIAGVDNGNQTSLERFKDNKRKAFFGKCLVVIQSGEQEGPIRLTAKGYDLKEATIQINNR
jgi:beta-galactosidase